MPSLRDPRGEAQRLIGLWKRLEKSRALDTNDFWFFHGLVRTEVTDEKAAAIPVGSLKDQVGSPAKLTALREAGVETVQDVATSSGTRLSRVRGVGPAFSAEVRAAARAVWDALYEVSDPRFTPDHPTTAQTDLLLLLSQRVLSDRATRGLREPAATFANEAGPLIGASLAAASPVARLVVGKRRRQRADDAVAELALLLAPHVESGLADRLADHLRFGTISRLKRGEVWADFTAHPQEYYAVLEEVTGGPRRSRRTYGAIPKEIVAAAIALDLDTSRLTATLRPYQEFGTRFALLQERAIIGDEMGLGKTIEAIAAMAHLAAKGSTHFLVVAPASILVNWEREVRAHSTLTPIAIHGPDRQQDLATWRRSGGVAITTYDTLRRLEADTRTPIDMLVVDEAHFAKNADAERSRRVAELAQRTDRVLFLTGTPMENRVNEFLALVLMVRPDLASAISSAAGIGGADAFQAEVAPVYLRRNIGDVLGELPPLIQTDEWVLLSTPERDNYRAAVRSGNLMAMRQSTFAPARGDSTKLARLVELCAEAADAGQKVLVFSYFRDTIDAVCAALGDAAHGPLVGDVAPGQRQGIADAFAAAATPAVLVSQIQVGGFGLNLQAASTVILCEPQIKPTLEAQAVARAHRMGQLRTVTVHRLLAAESVDETMVDMLRLKSELFDRYARHSAMAVAADDAGADDATLAARIVAAERERQGFGDAADDTAASGHTVSESADDASRWTPAS